MHAYDVIFGLIVLGTAFYGWRKGLATQIASIVSIVASSYVAMNFQDIVATKIDLAAPLNRWAAAILLFMGTAFAIWLVFRQVRTSIEALKLKEFDYQMGALLGAAKGFLVACMLTVGAYSLFPSQAETISDSRSAWVVARALTVAQPFIPQNFRGMLEPYLARFELAPQSGSGYEAYPGLDPEPEYAMPGAPPYPGGYPQGGYAPVAPPVYPPQSSGSPGPPAEYLPPGATPWNGPPVSPGAVRLGEEPRGRW